MENNRPNINPEDDYIIPKNCVAIVIGKDKIKPATIEQSEAQK